MKKKNLGSWILGLLGGLVVVLAGLAYWTAPALIERANLEPQERAAFYAWKNDKIHLPVEALNAPPCRPATRAATASFLQAWETEQKAAKALIDDVEGQEDDASESQGPIDSDALDAARFGPRLESLRAMMDAFAVLAAQPDYTIDAAASGGGTGLSVPNFIAIQTNIKLLRLRVYGLVRDGRLDEADKTVLLMFQASRSNPYDRFIASMIGIAGESIATDAWNHVVRHCDDKTLFHRMLDEQTEQARRPILFATGVPFGVVDTIGTLRALRRRGIDRDFQDKTGVDLCVMANLAEAEYIETQEIPSLRNQVKLVQDASERAQSLHGVADVLQNPNRLRGASSRVFFYQMMKLNGGEDAEARALVAAVRIDLLRLETAQKLYALEHGRPPAVIGDLVPQYLSAVPSDRFGPVALLQVAPGRYFSIGPDRVDDHGAIAYDPTNGALSAGDVFLNP